MPRQQTMKLVDLRVGLLVVAAIVALIVLILAVSGDISFFKRRMILYTDLPGAEGLKVGDEVRLAGVRVGTGKSVQFSNEIPKDMESTSAVRVEMQIDGDEAQRRIRGDSRAILRQLGLLGGEYVNISPGTLAADPVKNGDVIPGLQETTIGQVVESSDDLLNGFKALSSKLNQITQTITDGKGTIGRFVNDETFYLNLNKTTLEAQELLKRVREGDGTMGKLINDPKLYNDLQASVNSLQEVTDKISAGKGTVGKLVNEQEVYDKINSAAARLDSASQRIDEITAQVRSGKGAIGLMQVMPHMAEKLPLAGNLATIESNIEAGCFILADNIRRLGEPQGISSYFWGRHVRGDAYLEKVERARARVRESSPS